MPLYIMPLYLILTLNYLTDRIASAKGPLSLAYGAMVKSQIPHLQLEFSMVQWNGRCLLDSILTHVDLKVKMYSIPCLKFGRANSQFNN